MASAHLYRTLGTPTNEKKWTYSAWIKRSQYTAGHGQFLIACFTDASNRGRVYIEDGANSQLEVADRVSGSFDLQKKTSASLRDESAWYHIVVGHDRTISTPVTNMYINGVLQTSFAGDNTVAQNAATSWNKSGSTMLIGKYGGGAQYFSGLMAHVHFCDGYLYAASDFGETDTTTGIWKPKTSPTVTYGNNGCFLKFDNAANMGLDSSGESNNFTTSGTIIQPKDTPSNVFATFNPLDWANRNIALTNANGTATNTDTANWQGKYAMSTLGMSAGKYYAEFKVGNIGTNQLYVAGIIAEPESQNINSSIGSFGLGLYSPGKIFNLGSEAQTSLGAIVADDIIGVAFDVTNGTLQFYKNGSTIGSQITSIATAGKLWRFGVNGYDGSWVMHANFGNGYFGTTAVTSAQNPDDGIGIFEYSVPSGYKALCTKSINAQEYS